MGVGKAAFASPTHSDSANAAADKAPKAEALRLGSRLWVRIVNS